MNNTVFFYSLRNNYKSYFFLYLAYEGFNFIFIFVYAAAGKLIVSKLCRINKSKLV